MNTKVFFLTTSFSFAETHGIGSFKTKSIVLVLVLVLVLVFKEMSFCLRPSSSRVFFIRNYNKQTLQFICSLRLEQLRHLAGGLSFPPLKFSTSDERRICQFGRSKVESLEDFQLDTICCY